MTERLRAVLDTNALLRCVSRRSSFALVLEKLSAKRYDLYVSNEILMEYEEKLTEVFSVFLAETTLSGFEILSSVKRTDIYFNMRLIAADADDNKFVDCAFASNAHYSVSGDRHLNVLKTLAFPRIKVISLEEFKEIISLF